MSELHYREVNMSSAQFPLGSSRNTFIQSDPPNALVQFDPQPESSKTHSRPRSLSTPLTGSAIIISNDKPSQINTAALPTFSISATDPVHTRKEIKTLRRNSDKAQIAAQRIISGKNGVSPELDKKIKPINLKRDSDTKLSSRRRGSELGNTSHSPRSDIYGEAKNLFTQLEKATPGTYLLLKLGKKIDNYLPLIKKGIKRAMELSAHLANEMELFLDNVQSNPIYKHYKNAIKIVESGLKEDTTEDLFDKLQQSDSAYDYEIYTQLILQRALNELQLSSTSPRNHKKTAFLTDICVKLKILNKDYADKFSLGFQELFKNFHNEAKKQLGINSPRTNEPLMISDQRAHKIEANSNINSSTAAITYMLNICECEAIRVLMREASKLLDDLKNKAIPGNFLRIKIGREIDTNREIFKKWMSAPSHPLSFNELNDMKIFYESISDNEAYATYLTMFHQEQKPHNEQMRIDTGKKLIDPMAKHQNEQKVKENEQKDKEIERIEHEQKVKEIEIILLKLKEEIKSLKITRELCVGLNPSDKSRKNDCLERLSKKHGLLEITMEALLEQAIKECQEMSKIKLPEPFIDLTKYKIDNFSRYINKFPEGYIDLFNRFKKAITKIEHSQQIQKDVTVSDNTSFSIMAINLQLKVFEEDILHLQQEETAWVLENLPLLESFLKELETRKIIELRKVKEERNAIGEQKLDPTKSPSAPTLTPSPASKVKDKELLLVINEKLENAKKFLRLEQIREDILKIVKNSEWTQEYLFHSDDPRLHNLREQVLTHTDALASEVPTPSRPSRTRKRFHSRDDLSSISLEKSSSPRLDKSTSPSPRSKKTLTRSNSSASIEDSLITRIKTSHSPEAKRPPASLSDSTNSDSQSPRVTERVLVRAKSCKPHSSSPRKISGSPRIEDLKKKQEAINNEYINLLIGPGADVNLQRNLISTYPTFFKPINDDPILVEILKSLRKKFLEEGPCEKQAVLVVLRELLYNPVIALLHFQEMKPYILEIINDAKSKSHLLQRYIEVVEKRISSLDTDLRRLGAPKFYTLEDYSNKFAVENTDLSNYENNINIYSQSLKRLNLFDYIQIGPLEFKTANISSVQSPHICALGNRFTQLSDWVLESIFLKGKNNEAAHICQMIEFFIDMMDSLLDNVSKTPFNDSLRKAVTPDYLSAQAIFVALQRSFVENLFLKSVKKKKLDINIRHTNENVGKPKINISEKHLKKYLTFKEILTNNANFKELRGKIKEDLHCIPPVQLTNRDITYAFEQQPITSDNKINLRCVESLGNLLLDMSKHQKHLIPMYLPFGKQSSLFENLTINFDQVFQVMITNKKYHDDKDLFDSDILDTLCRNKVKEIFPSKEENTTPKKEEKKARFET